jgi:predicted acetyltransferase
VDVVIEVTDDLIKTNSGRYRLTGDSEQATCEPSDSAPDVSLSVRELSAAYLGGRALSEFATTGRVTENAAGALNALTTALRWPVAPVSIEVF